MKVFKKYRKKNPIFRTESNKQSTHSFLGKSVGLKAWNCLTCVISPSTHQSITVLLCEAVLLKIYSDLNKGLKPQGRENRKILSSSNWFKLEVINGAMTASVLILGEWLLFFFNLSSQSDSVSWWKMSDELRAQLFINFSTAVSAFSSWLINIKHTSKKRSI